MMRLNNIQVIYSEVILVLKGLSLEVPAGQIVTLLGANGAGKTTTLKAISGLLKTEDGQVTDGRIEFMGRRIDGQDPERICRLGIVQVMEGRKVLENLTVEENLRIGAYTRRDPKGGCGPSSFPPRRSLPAPPSGRARPTTRATRGTPVKRGVPEATRDPDPPGRMCACTQRTGGSADR